MTMDAVQKELVRLHRLTAWLLLVGVIGVLGFSVFAIFEVRHVRSQQSRLNDLNDSLCVTLGRAGIILEGSRENPCERLPR